MNGRDFAVRVPKGYRVGSWEVREPLASGAFGSVYAARNTGHGTAQPDHAGHTGYADHGELPQTAALKFLPTGTRTPRQLHHLRELAEREVDLLRRLQSPRLIRMYEALTVDDPDHPELDGATVLVLERAEGSLDTLLARSPKPESGPALLAQVCEGLAQLHHAGWVHADLKPANVLLLKDGSVRLADFNLAAELEGTHAYSPAFSTPDYTPPELLWAEIDERGQRIRPTADLWAFGVLAHLVLTGSLPLPGGTAEARRDAAVRYARGAEELRLSPELPDPWREIITDCLARTHEERAALAADMTALLRRVEQTAGADRSPRLPRLRPRRRPHPAVLAAVFTALVLGAATATTYALRDSDPATAAPPTCEKPVLHKDSTHGTWYHAGKSGTWDFTVKQGDGGSQVEELQCLLKYRHGITAVGETDGDFGPLTHAAVLTFQKRAGLDTDGTVGPKTWRALRATE
ncbi:serine/threonine-protein kinase [Streptomyces sp. NPDC050704]|uniref:serine/threonine-protein kinase n=1 Tax=Streptomyces sp. NPDC050704 TaxID=3157219 RepID=UPI0034404B2F